MTTYISLIRAVNVGGKTVRMADLKAAYEEMGFTNVRTYLQSGNILFDSPQPDPGSLAGAIEGQMVHKINVSASVLLRTAPDLKRTIDANPFLHGRLEDISRLHVTFLKTAPTQARLSALKKPEGEADEFMVSGQEIFLFCPNGYGRTKLNNTFFERKLDVIATTRNWNTVTALYAMAMEGQ